MTITTRIGKIPLLHTPTVLISFPRYGDEIARLTQAKVKAKRAYDVARKGKISPTVIQDILVSITKKDTSTSA